MEDLIISHANPNIVTDVIKELLKEFGWIPQWQHGFIKRGKNLSEYLLESQHANGTLTKHGWQLEFYLLLACVSQSDTAQRGRYSFPYQRHDNAVAFL